MTLPLTNQIELGERDLPQPDHDGSAPTASEHPVRAAGARAIRSSVDLGLRLADRLDPTHQPA